MTIQFRGKDPVTSDYHYGFYVEDKYGDAYIVKTDGHFYPVIKKSVQQFIGNDVNNLKVFTNTLVKTEQGNIRTKLVPYPENINEIDTLL